MPQGRIRIRHAAVRHPALSLSTSSRAWRTLPAPSARRAERARPAGVVCAARPAQGLEPRQEQGPYIHYVPPDEVDLEDLVEYDLDQEDAAWLMRQRGRVTRRQRAMLTDDAIEELLDRCRAWTDRPVHDMCPSAGSAPPCTGTAACTPRGAASGGRWHGPHRGTTPHAGRRFEKACHSAAKLRNARQQEGLEDEELDLDDVAALLPLPAATEARPPLLFETACSCLACSCFCATLSCSASGQQRLARQAAF